MILVHASPTSLLKDHGRHPNLGVLSSPRRVYGQETAGWPWAADNDCFNGWDEPRYLRMLDKIAGRKGCLFVTAPDVVGDSVATLELFHTWKDELYEVGQPVAFVAQDGLENPPWQAFQALFVGGTTAWKLGPQAARLVRTGIALGKHIHMGRVNTRRRITYAKALGCHSIDGTNFSMFRRTNLPWALDLCAGHTQLMLEAS